MSSVNYSLDFKGIRLIDSKDAFIVGKNGKSRLNPRYKIIGKLNISMPSFIVGPSDKKPSYRGDINVLNKTAKRQIVDHFYDKAGNRNRKTVAYFGVLKSKEKNDKLTSQHGKTLKVKK